MDNRAASALTHPVTIGALGLLLVNDLVLKSLWPGSWATGKLSDFAWLVFAMPLLAWLLSLGSARVSYRQWAFAGAYAGLPLLYFLYNTFTPVYRTFIDTASLVFRYTPSSPQDATDSLVIPFAVMLALWIWRRAGVERDVLRRRWTLLIASLAVLASIATSPPEPDEGVIGVGVDHEGVIYAFAGLVYRLSADSWIADEGVTWNSISSLEPDITLGGPKVATPRGVYVIEGTDVILKTTDGQARLVYSTAFLGSAGNKWLQERETSGLGERVLAREPLSVVYDDASGNVILALGIEGVVIGTPDNQWHRVGVGPYTPTDFSFGSKLQELLDLHAYWAASLTLSFVVAASTLILAGSTTRNAYSGEACLGVIAPAAAGAFYFAVFALFPNNDDATIPWPLGDQDITILAIPILAAVGLVAVMLRRRKWRHVPIIMGFVLATNVMFLLAHIIWLQAGIPRVIVGLCAVGIAAGLGYALAHYLRDRPGEDGTEMELPIR